MTINPDDRALWNDLDELRDLSRRVLLALEHEDLDEVQQLAAHSKVIVSRLTPALTARKSIEATDDDLTRTLGMLERMNARIVEELSSRRERCRADLAKAADARRRLAQHQRAAHGPVLLDQTI